MDFLRRQDTASGNRREEQRQNNKITSGGKAEMVEDKQVCVVYLSVLLIAEKVCEARVN